MKNKILNFTKEEVGNYIVSDYFSKKINIYTLFDEIDMSLYTDTYKIQDNDKLERISLELYGTPDYWDLLLLINEKNPLFDMPYDYDNLVDSVDIFIEKFTTLLYINSPFDETRKQELIYQWRNLCEDNNEKIRFIYIIKPVKLIEFTKILRDKGFL